MAKKITLTEDDLRRLLGQAQDIGAQRYEHARRAAESQAHYQREMARALEWGDWTIPEPELRALMARGRHHGLCRWWRRSGKCTCGIDALEERDREAGDEADALAGYGLV